MKKDKLRPAKTNLRALFENGKNGHMASVARLLSLIESDLKKAAPFLSTLKENQRSVRVGVTGPPGAGKSTLINKLIQIYRSQNLKVAVLAVDPSSPFSGGAILGDRVRMTSEIDSHVFIRSIGSRGGLGGLSVATGAMSTVLEALFYDVVIIETVGVGQTELQVMNHADATAVVLVPESGDVIQTLKAGILEIADLFIVNKADRPGAEILMHELVALIEMDSEKNREVILTSAMTQTGMSEFAEKLLNKGRLLKKSRRQSQGRLQNELKNLILWSLQQKLEKQVRKIKIRNVYQEFKKTKT